MIDFAAVRVFVRYCNGVKNIACFFDRERAPRRAHTNKRSIDRSNLDANKK